MENTDMIRKVLQTFAIILFVFQFQQSVRKYFQYPVVEQKSRVSVKDLPNPVVYVCHESQFNYTKALNKGYNNYSFFMAGIRENSTTISWGGQWENKTYKDLENILIDSDYSSIESNTLVRSTNLWNVNEKNSTFLFPHGVCVEFTNLPQHSSIRIASKKKVTILFVDPARANDIRTEETIDAKTSMGPTYNTYFTAASYKLEYWLYDDSIYDGTTCTDYAKTDMSYGECLNNVWTQELMDTYGCLPPWVSTNNSKIICKEPTNIDAMAIKYKTRAIENINELFKNYELDVFKRCLFPCKTMKIKIKKVAYRSNYLNHAFLEARSTDLALVHTQVYSYDILSLTVDFGSALGLWLGLSCLSILHNVLENWILMKSYWKK